MTLFLEEMYRVLLKGGKGAWVRYDLTTVVIVLKCCGRSGIAGSYQRSTFVRVQHVPGFLFFTSSPNSCYLFLFSFLKYIYSWAELGLHLCAGFSLVVASRGYSVAVPGLLTAAASLVVEYRL